MNANRIQELAEQAGLLGPSSRVGKAHEATQKFAELIIAECAKLCEPAAQVERPQNCGSGFCSCIECVMEPKPLTDAERKSYQAGHNAGVAHHKQAMGERVLIGWTPQELRQIKGMAHETQDVYRAMQAKIYEYERILREKNKEIAALNKTQLDQALERNFCPRCGRRLMSALGPVSIHTCTPPHARTFDDYGNKIV